MSALYSEDRPWGRFENFMEEENYKVKRLTVHPKSRLSLQSHRHRGEHWVVVRGPATVRIDDSTKVLESNEGCFIPQGSKHRLENPNDHDIVVVEVQYGDYFGEEDIIRYEDDYKRN